MFFEVSAHYDPLLSDFSFGQLANGDKILLWVKIIHCVEENMKHNPDKFGTNGSFGQAYGLANFFFAAGVMVGLIWVGFFSEQAGWGCYSVVFGAVLWGWSRP